jgi:PAS domain S-box-containing protein
MIMTGLENGKSYLREIEKLTDVLLYKDKELKDREIFLGELLDLVPAAIFYRDLSGVYLGCNEAYAKMLGLKCEDIIGHDMADIYSKEDYNKLCEMQSFLIKGETVTEIREITVRGKARKYIFQRSCYPDSADEYVGVIGVAIDITEHPNCELIQWSKRNGSS